MCIGLLLSSLETTIVSTSLVSIVDQLQGFDKASWIVTAYLATNTAERHIGLQNDAAYRARHLYDILNRLRGFRFHDIFHCSDWTRRLVRIIFRALQGMGGSGIYSLSTLMVPLMVPPAKFATYITIVTSIFAISSVLGPIVGGAIADKTSWRWVFYINGPGGALAVLLVAFSVPFGFPYGKSRVFLDNLRSRRTWRRIDFAGAFASLAASILLIFALQQGGVMYPWNSAPIVSTFVLSGVLWLFLLGWERWLSARNGICEPVFPQRLITNRFVLGLLLNGFLTGAPFMTTVINIPQRLQTVNSFSAIDAGIRMLPLLLLTPVASALSGLMVARLRVPPLFVLLLGAALQCIGVGLFSSIGHSNLQVPAAQYGYQVLMGLGFGFSLSTILMMATIVVAEKDLADQCLFRSRFGIKAVTMGAATQLRVLGGTIGLAGAAALLMDNIRSEAARFLTPAELSSVLSSSGNIRLLSSEKQLETRMVFAAAYSRQMRAMLYFSLGALLSVMLLVEKKPRRVVHKTAGQNQESAPSS
uniref:Major facilitator superfamily (MFS) profile domain-containing protein n=1 Tax=Pyricularia oryzae (strain P131) TaxID=1143193 RepID=L7JCG2_PYRO1